MSDPLRGAPAIFVQMWAAAEKEGAEQRKRIDKYGLALMMIAEGCENPQEVARRALEGK
jgi:hypothetical protein